MFWVFTVCLSDSYSHLFFFDLCKLFIPMILLVNWAREFFKIQMRFEMHIILLLKSMLFKIFIFIFYYSLKTLFFRAVLYWQRSRAECSFPMYLPRHMHSLPHDHTYVLFIHYSDAKFFNLKISKLFKP